MRHFKLYVLPSIQLSCTFAPFINAKLISPNGNSIQGNTGNVEHLINQSNQFFRVSYPAIPTTPNGSHSGKWKAILEISKESIKKNMKLFLELKRNENPITVRSDI